MMRSVCMSWSVMAAAAVGLQVTPISSVTIDARFRVLKPASGKTDSDVFVQMHLYR